MIKIITNFSTLLMKASNMAKARLEYEKNNTEENRILYEEAKFDHDSYKELCLKSDEMMIGLRVGDL